MDFEGIQRKGWLAWASITLLAVLCGVLAVLQYRWIGEVANAERQRLREDLQSRLNLLRQSFSEQISADCRAYVPVSSEIDQLGREEAYLVRFRRQRQSQDQIVRTIALAIPQEGELVFLVPDRDGRHFLPAEWPAGWSPMLDRLRARLNGGPMPPNRSQALTLIEFPRFGSDPKVSKSSGPPREQEWLILDLNSDFIAHSILPGLLNRFLGDPGKLDYDVQVVSSANPTYSIYRSDSEGGPGIAWEADASVKLPDVAPSFPALRETAPAKPNPAGAQGSIAGPIEGLDSAPPPNGGAGLWLLRVRRHAGSLEAIVAQARRRNIALALGILLLILATVVSLVRYSRRAQEVAELQMNFVAGVSHELRTPLTVIRTAAHNLLGDLASRPDQVVRYASLIARESERLAALVEQVLRYGSARAGRVLQNRETAAIQELIEESLQSSRLALDRPNLTVEKQIEPSLPPVFADREALKHALQNLLENAVKHGSRDQPWVGIFAAAKPDDGPSVVEIRIVDRGPGIPQEECDHIFDSFFRGRRALQDQVHGTGLGLNLVKTIVEAHGGTINVKSKLGEGTEFTLRIPAAPPETNGT